MKRKKRNARNRHAIKCSLFLGSFLDTFFTVTQTTSSDHVLSAVNHNRTPPHEFNVA